MQLHEGAVNPGWFRTTGDDSGDEADGNCHQNREEGDTPHEIVRLVLLIQWQQDAPDGLLARDLKARF